MGLGPVRSKVSEFCTRLTTLTQEQVDGGVSFEQACGQLRKAYRTRDRAWASYGDYDRRQFERQCQATGVASLAMRSRCRRYRVTGILRFSFRSMTDRLVIRH